MKNLYELQKETGEKFFDVIEDIGGTISVKGHGKFDVSVATFFKGFCVQLAWFLKAMYGYKIEAVSVFGDLVHVFCTTEVNGKKYYIDARGITDDRELFFGIYDPWPEYASFVYYEDEEAAETLIDSSEVPFVRDEISDAMVSWLLQHGPNYNVKRIA